METISTRSTTISKTSGRPSMITPSKTPQSPHIIPLDEESLSSQPPQPPSIDIECLPPPKTKVSPTKPRDETLHKKSVEPLSIRNRNLVHKDATNLPPIYLSSKLAPCENRTQFESQNLHKIFGCRQFCNQKHLTTATNASLVNSGILPSAMGSFDTIANPNRGKTIKWRCH